LLDPYDMAAARERAERAEKRLMAEPIENAERNEPMDPIEQAEPIEQTDRKEPFDPIERTELSDHSDQRDVDEFLGDMAPSCPGALRGAGRVSLRGSTSISRRAGESAPVPSRRQSARTHLVRGPMPMGVHRAETTAPRSVGVLNQVNTARRSAPLRDLYRIHMRSKPAGMWATQRAIDDSRTRQP
jgi:hypothetical protein